MAKRTSTEERRTPDEARKNERRKRAERFTAFILSARRRFVNGKIPAKRLKERKINAEMEIKKNVGNESKLAKREE